MLWVCSLSHGSLRALPALLADSVVQGQRDGHGRTLRARSLLSWNSHALDSTALLQAGCQFCAGPEVQAMGASNGQSHRLRARNKTSA